MQMQDSFTLPQRNSTDLLDTSNANVDVLIIGAGLAGLSLALKLPCDLNICVLSKADAMTSSSSYAQGGIAASIGKTDSPAYHTKDTLVAGVDLCCKTATTRIVDHAATAVDWLVELGVPFTCKHSTDLKASDVLNPNTQTDNQHGLHLTKEGGHSKRRIVHAADATGRYVMQTLLDHVAMRSNITLHTHQEAVQLLLEAKTCVGAQVYDHKQQKHTVIHAKAVALATGGLSPLYKRATAPAVCTGDGMMMAWEAGCRLANLEFVQFHPTGLVHGDSQLLISEALRGEGAKLICPKNGHRFMLEVDARAELAPRDIVARGIDQHMQKHQLDWVHLDISHRSYDFICTHFPDLYQRCLKLGIDITKDPIPVAPTAHYTCGGIVTDVAGHTDLTGLYAIGEVAHTGLHGANRLASNSLLECVVMGHMAAEQLPSYLNKLSLWPKPPSSHAIHVITPTFAPTRVWQPYPTYKGSDCKLAQQTLSQVQQILSTCMGINRNHTKLVHADYSLKLLALQIKGDIRLQRIIRLALFMVNSALARKESRGGHYRTDYPLLADKALNSMITAAHCLPNFHTATNLQATHQKLDPELLS